MPAALVACSPRCPSLKFQWFGSQNNHPPPMRTFPGAWKCWLAQQLPKLPGSLGSATPNRVRYGHSAPKGRHYPRVYALLKHAEKLYRAVRGFAICYQLLPFISTFDHASSNPLPPPSSRPLPYLPVYLV